jgi:glycosyltransferase involved in cell wall biosynthesis
MTPKSSTPNRRVAVVLTSLSLSGGTSIIIEKLKKAPKNVDLTILLPSVRDLAYGNDFAVDFKTYNIRLGFLDDPDATYDLVVCTFWRTVPMVLNTQLTAGKFLFFCQSLEDRFYADPAAPLLQEVLAAQEVYGLNLPTVTEASWIKKALDLRSSQVEKATLIKNPILMDYKISKELDRYRGIYPNKLVIVIEGHEAWFKGVDKLLKSILLINDFELEVHLVGNSLKVSSFLSNHKVIRHNKLSRYEFQKLLANSDLLLKNSHVEGMYGPPLEAFSLGTSCITSNVTGHEEFIIHLENALVVNIDDVYGITNWLRKLHTDRDLLESLNKNAKKTAEKWSAGDNEAKFWAEALKGATDRSRLSLRDYLTLLKNPWASIEPNVTRLDLQVPGLQAYFKHGVHLLTHRKFNIFFKGVYRFLRNL